MPHGTVKNALTELRKRGLVEDTGETDPRTRAKKVRLTRDESISQRHNPISDGDSVTPDDHLDDFRDLMDRDEENT